MAFETRRLRLAPFAAPLWRDWIALHSEARVRRLMLDVPVVRPSHVGVLLKWYERTAAQRPGLGLWHASLLTDGVFAGSFSLMPLEGSGAQVELGCLLLPTAWGRGLALEGALAVLRQGFAQGLGEVLALSHPDNHPVQHCLRRLGFRPEGRVRRYGRSDVLQYRLTAACWRDALMPVRAATGRS